MSCKRFLFIPITFLACQFAWAQHFYGSVSGGYQHIIQGTQAPSYIVNSFHQISNPWFWRLEDLSFSDAISTDLNFGHFLTDNIGYELTGGYFNPLTKSEADAYTEHQMSGRFFRFSAKLILSIPIKRFNVYTKLGVNNTIGKLYYYQRFNNPGELSSSVDESTLKYEYTNGSRFGYNLAFGTSFDINSKWSFFTEIYAIYQPFEPSKGQRVEQTKDGVDEMQYGSDPYFSQVQFGTESEWSTTISIDKTQPQKLYKRNYSLGGIGINLGIKVTLWSKIKKMGVLP